MVIFRFQTELPGPSLRPLGQAVLVKSAEGFPGLSRPTVALMDRAQQTKTNQNKPLHDQQISITVALPPGDRTGKT